MEETSTAGITRRALVRSAGGAGLALAASAGLPAWARSLAAVGAKRKPDSRPFPNHPVGFESMPEIEHIVVVMMENHSFDNLLGMLPNRVKARSNVDGLPLDGKGSPTTFNPDAEGNRVYSKHAGSPCQLQGKPTQAWNASHRSWDKGRNDGFVVASGNVAMWYWEKSDLPFIYSLAKYFPVGERYFQSVLGQTYPNRRFLFSGTASGTIATNSTTFSVPAANGTIFHRLNEVGLDWKCYYEDLPSPLIIPNFGGTIDNLVKGLDVFLADAKAGKLPPVSYVEPNFGTTSQEDPQDIQVGEDFLSDVVHAVMDSPRWSKTALFFTYDEHGGYFDHVPPPHAIKPDSIPPILGPNDLPGVYGARYGFRVPLVVVSPWARPGYVSHRVQDHTSILAFMERKWNLPAMTFRDANADPMLDYFDFTKPAFKQPPELERALPLGPGLKKCTKHGLFPPLPTPGSKTGRAPSEGIERPALERELARRLAALR